MSDSMVIGYPRGSVWYCDLNMYTAHSQSEIEGVQLGTRPVLIISNDAGNKSSKSVVVACLTSNISKAKYPINVECDMEDGTKSVILCNQIQTVSKGKLTEFVGIMPTNIMDQVDTAITLAMDMERPQADLKVLDETVNKIIVRYERAMILRKEELEHNVTQDQVNKIAERLEEIFCDVVIPLDKGVKAAPILSTFVAANAESKETDASLAANTAETKETTPTKETTIQTNTEASAPKAKRKPRGFWTPEKQAELIADNAKLSMDEIREKWGIQTVKTLYQMCYTFNKNLNK